MSRVALGLSSKRSGRLAAQILSSSCELHSTYLLSGAKMTALTLGEGMRWIRLVRVTSTEILQRRCSRFWIPNRTTRSM